MLNFNLNIQIEIFINFFIITYKMVKVVSSLLQRIYIIMNLNSLIKTNRTTLVYLKKIKISSRGY